ADGHQGRRIDGHRRADDVDGGRRNGGRALSDYSTGCVQTKFAIVGRGVVRRRRYGGEVGDIGDKFVARDITNLGSGHKPDVLRCTTEIRAMEDRRDPCVTIAPIVPHTGETIDDDFGIIDSSPCRRCLDECERGGCDDPMNGLHDYLPPWCWADAPTL